MIRLVISSYSFEALPFDGTLAVCQAMGMKGVDISAFHGRGNGGYEPDEIGANPQKWAADVKGRLDKYGLDAVDFFPQFATSFDIRSMNDPDPAVVAPNLQSFRGIVEFAKTVGFRGITILPGIDHDGRTKEQNLDASAATLRELVKIAHDSGIHLMFEAHMGSLTNTPELAIALIERTPGLKVTLAYSHFLLQYIPVERIDKLIPYTGHFHIRQSRPGRLQTRFKDGILDFVDLAHKLEAVGYDGAMSLEYVCGDWYDMNNMDVLSESVATRNALAPHFRIEK